jgi:isocitrate dehydrogenase
MALAASLEHLAETQANPKAKILAETLDAATGTLLLENKAPGHATGELDNRGSHFYLAMYWAQALAAQSDDVALQNEFTATAQALTEQEQTIVNELAAVQGQSIDMGGYFVPDDAKMNAIMRPSETFNAILS